MSEWFKVQPWKGCVREIAPRVRIPLSAPIEESCKENFLFLFKFARIRTGGIAKATVFAFARPGVIAEYPAKHNLPRSESLFLRQSKKVVKRTFFFYLNLQGFEWWKSKPLIIKITLFLR